MTDICDRCEREIPAGTRVCPYCGRVVSSPAERRADLKRIAWTVVLFAAVMAAVMLYQFRVHGVAPHWGG